MNDMPMCTRTISNVDTYADDSTISVLQVVETKKLLGLQVDNFLTWRVKYRQSQLVFKAVNELAPDYMCALFKSVSNILTRTTSSRIKLLLIAYKYGMI